VIVAGLLPGEVNAARSSAMEPVDVTSAATTRAVAAAEPVSNARTLPHDDATRRRSLPGSLRRQWLDDSASAASRERELLTFSRGPVIVRDVPRRAYRTARNASPKCGYTAPLLLAIASTMSLAG
jgi:hypothetical protein